MRKTHLVQLCLWYSVLALGSAPAVQAGGPYQFYSVMPCRIVDTRGPVGPTGGPSLVSGNTRSFPIANQCGVPSTAQAATLNITLVGPTQNGFLSIWPYLTTMPLVSTINANAGESAIANGAIVPLTTGQTFSVSVIYGTQFAGTADVLIDVTGYFQ